MMNIGSSSENSSPLRHEDTKRLHLSLSALDSIVYFVS